jgi:hypothetical protein
MSLNRVATFRKPLFQRFFRESERFLNILSPEDLYPLNSVVGAPAVHAASYYV